MHRWSEEIMPHTWEDEEESLGQHCKSLETRFIALQSHIAHCNNACLYVIFPSGAWCPAAC